VNRFTAAFQRLTAEGACGLFPYLMAGYPDESTSQRLAQAALEAGADGFEIGVPFSDPLADGATLQRANMRALERGAGLHTALDLAKAIRQASADTPISVMSYYNPLRQRGDRQIALDFEAAGVDAAIVPDMPPEESADLRTALHSRGIGLVQFLAPTSPMARIRAVAALDPVWIYCVALVGVTGARRDLSSALGGFLERVRAETAAPLVVGFGISQPDHAQTVAHLGAAGVIVASALVDLIDHSDDPIAAARDYLSGMKSATQAIT
jgi:tryptophan synthase alpha chain